MTLRHQESVRRGAIEVAAHEPVIDAVDNLGAGIGRPMCRAPDLLRYVQDPAPIALATRRALRAHRRRCVGIIFVHRSLTPASIPATLMQINQLSTDALKNIARTGA